MSHAHDQTDEQDPILVPKQQPASPQRQATQTSLTVAATALAVTLGFHFLLAPYHYGVSVAAFVLLLIVGFHVIAVLTGHQGNMWAYIFLLPALCAALAEVLYANTVMHVLAIPLIYASLALFSYWLTAPAMAFHQVLSFWPSQVLTETVMPMPSTKGFLDGFSILRHGKRIFAGLAIAFPFVLIIGILFGSADPLFAKYLGKLMFWRDTPFDITLFNLIRDIIVGLYLVRGGWAMLTRSLEQRRPSFSNWQATVDPVMLSTFLSALNLLFLAFIGFQLVYFFGGENIVQSQGLTYANYARNGFWQLLIVAGLVFVISSGLYRATNMHRKTARWLTLSLIIQTGIVIASAIKRLNLYIDVYGLTLSRWWAMEIILFIALILGVIAFGALLRRPSHAVFKIIFLATLFVFSGSLLYNSEAAVVRFNAQRFLGEGRGNLDLSYIGNLSSDAVPAIVDLVRADWPAPSAATTYNANDSDPRVNLKRQTIAELRSRNAILQRLAAQDWRNLSWSDYRAMGLINSLP